MATNNGSPTVPAARRPFGFTDQLIEPLGRLRSEVDRLFEGFPNRMPTFASGKVDAMFTFPAVEMKETAKAFKLSVEVPGVEAKDVEVTVENGALVIKGEKNEERDEEEKGYSFSERSYGSFERRIELPPSADHEKIKAKAKDGVLKITIPKNAEADKNKRRIAIEG